MAYPPQGDGGITWQDVVNNLKTQGALNKEYDPDLNGVIDVDGISIKEWLFIYGLLLR